MIHQSDSEFTLFPNQLGRYYNHLDSYVLRKNVNPLKISSNMSWTTNPQNINLSSDSPIWGTALLMSRFYRVRNISTTSGSFHYFTKQLLNQFILKMKQISKQNWQCEMEKLSGNVSLQSTIYNYYRFPIKLLMDALGFRAVDDCAELINNLQQAINRIMVVSQWSSLKTDRDLVVDRRLQSFYGMNQLVHLLRQSDRQLFSESIDSTVINQWVESELILLMIASIHTTQLQMMSLLHLFLFNPRASSLSLAEMIQYSSPLTFSVRFLKIHNTYSMPMSSSMDQYQTKPWLIPLLSNNSDKSGVNHFGFGEHKCCGVEIANSILSDSVEFIKALLSCNLDFSMYRISKRWSRHPSPLFRGWRLYFDD